MQDRAGSLKKKLLATANGAVLRSHSIVHAGDLNSHKKARPIEERLATRYVMNVESLVTHVEALLGKVLNI